MAFHIIAPDALIPVETYLDREANTWATEMLT